MTEQPAADQEMRRIRRQMRGPDATEARAAMLGANPEATANTERGINRLPGYFGFGRRRLDLKVEEQFSDAWFALGLLLTVIGLITRNNALLTIAVLLFTIVAVSWVWNRLAFFGLEYERDFSERRAFVGETIDLELKTANRKILPISWLRIADIFPSQLPLSVDEIRERKDSGRGELSTFWALKWYEQAIRSYQITAKERGFFRYGPAKLETGDLFGLFRTTRQLDDEQILIVYPKIMPLASLGLPAKEPFGDLSAPRFMFEDPIRTVGIRDYRPEDDFRLLHWKASARRQTLQTRVLEPASSHNLVVILNVATLAQHWQGVIPEVLEQAVSIAASVCYHGIEQHWPVGLLANGALPRSDQPIKVLPGRSPGQITAILEMLAAVTPFATAPIEKLIAAESPRLPWGSTLVVISALLTEDLAATLLDLKKMGRRLVLLSLDPAPVPETLRDLLVYRIPRAEMPSLDLGPPIAGETTLLNPAQLQQNAIRRAAQALRS